MRVSIAVDKLYQFLQSATFNSIRTTLIKVVTTIEYAIENPTKELVVEGSIKTMLPSMCFITYNNKNDQVTGKLFNKIKDLKNGDPVKVTLYGNRITDINK